MILNFLFLTPLFIIGIISSYTDIKYGKIRNKWIILGFGWVVILYLSLGLYNCFYLHQSENIHYLTGMIINGLIALLIGYLLWNFKLLAAGDAKLIALFALLIPLEFYPQAYFLYFFSFSLLINIFVPFLLFLGTKALIFGLREGYKKIKKPKEKQGEFVTGLKDKFIPWTIKILNTYIAVIFIFVVLRLIFGEITKLFSGFFPDSSSIFALLILIVFYRPLFGLIKKRKSIGLGISALGAIYGVYLFTTHQTDLLLSILKIALVLVVLVAFIRQILDFYIEREEVRKIKIRNIEEGMYLSRQTLNELRNRFKDRHDFLPQEKISREQVDLIRVLFTKDPDREIKIYKTFALAPFILLGAVITVLTKSSFIDVVLNIFPKLW